MRCNWTAKTGSYFMHGPEESFVLSSEHNHAQRKGRNPNRQQNQTRTYHFAGPKVAPDGSFKSKYTPFLLRKLS